MSNVLAMPGFRTPDEARQPNEKLIAVLRDALGMAESGQLQCFIGTGFTHDGLRLATWCDDHNDIYQMLGSIAWLQAEYIHRHTD
jgi:hypothetical protein